MVFFSLGDLRVSFLLLNKYLRTNLHLCVNDSNKNEYMLSKLNWKQESYTFSRKYPFSPSILSKPTIYTVKIVFLQVHLDLNTCELGHMSKFILKSAKINKG